MHFEDLFCFTAHRSVTTCHPFPTIWEDGMFVLWALLVPCPVPYTHLCSITCQMTFITTTVPPTCVFYLPLTPQTSTTTSLPTPVLYHCFPLPLLPPVLLYPHPTFLPPLCGQDLIMGPPSSTISQLFYWPPPNFPNSVVLIPATVLTCPCSPAVVFATLIPFPRHTLLQQLF